MPRQARNASVSAQAIEIALATPAIARMIGRMTPAATSTLLASIESIVRMPAGTPSQAAWRDMALMMLRLRCEWKLDDLDKAAARAADRAAS